MSERRQIIQAELISLMDDMLVHSISAIAESEERAEEVQIDIMEALSLYGEVLSQLSEGELIELRNERLLKRQ